MFNSDAVVNNGFTEKEHHCLLRYYTYHKECEIAGFCLSGTLLNKENGKKESEFLFPSLTDSGITAVRNSYLQNSPQSLLKSFNLFLNHNQCRRNVLHEKQNLKCLILITLDC